MTQAVPSGRGPALDAVFQPVQPPTTFEQTVERLGIAIRLGLLPPGTRLPPERELADEPPLSRERVDPPLGDEARAVLDYRVVVETGATVLAAERTREDDLDRLQRLTEDMTLTQGATSRSTAAPT